jgi:hypothetical protein
MIGMLSATQIPDEVWRVAMVTYHREIRRNPERAWQLAIAAAIAAWPGMSQLAENDSASIREMAALIIPLKETQNAE